MKGYIINALGIAGACVGLFLAETHGEAGLSFLSVALLFAVVMPSQSKGA